MLLAVDVGNTQTLIGAYQGRNLLTSWRIDTDRGISADVLGATLVGFLAREGIGTSEIRNVVIGSVVPVLCPVWEEISTDIFATKCLIVGLEHLEGLLEVRTQGSGADRLANAVAGANLYGAPMIVVDLGTATDAEVIGNDGSFIGGFIAPGLKTSMNALVDGAAQLSNIELVHPETVIGTTTAEAIQAGVVLGEAARIDGLVCRIWDQLGNRAPVVLTGGLSSVMGPLCETVTTVNPELTLWGLMLIFEHNAR